MLRKASTAGAFGYTAIFQNRVCSHDLLIQVAAFVHVVTLPFRKIAFRMGADANLRGASAI